MHTPLQPPSRSSVALSWVTFVATAALVATALQLSLEAPWFGVLAGAVVTLIAVPRWRARQRFRQLVLSGNVNELLDTWEPNLDPNHHPRTFGPLMRATALAAHGLVNRAHQVLAIAQRGPAWEGALEHRLFVETLLACWEGRFEDAQKSAQEIDGLPLPPSLWKRGRAATLRSATLSMTRAFSGESKPKDAKWLRLGAKQNPLLFWPMRYAEAQLRLTLGQTKRAEKLLANAPAWPTESVFAAITHHLRSELASASAA